MADFSHLAALQPDAQEPKPYKFNQIKGTPTLWAVPATEDNAPFFNEVLRRSNQRAQGGGRSATVTKLTVEQSRAEDIELLSTYAVKRWDVRDASGEPVEFSAQECVEFLTALPHWLLDPFRAWATAPANFVAQDDGLGEA